MLDLEASRLKSRADRERMKRSPATRRFGSAMLRGVALLTIRCCNCWNWMNASASAQDARHFHAVMQRARSSLLPASTEPDLGASAESRAERRRIERSP